MIPVNREGGGCWMSSCPILCSKILELHTFSLVTDCIKMTGYPHTDIYTNRVTKRGNNMSCMYAAKNIFIFPEGRGKFFICIHETHVIAKLYHPVSQYVRMYVPQGNSN